MNFYLINPDAEHRGILLIKKYLFVFYQGMSEFIAQNFQTTVGDLSFSAFFFFLSVSRSSCTTACEPMNNFLLFKKRIPIDYKGWKNQRYKISVTLFLNKGKFLLQGFPFQSLTAN